MKNTEFKNVLYFLEISILMQAKSSKFNVTIVLYFIRKYQKAKLDVKF